MTDRRRSFFVLLLAVGLLAASLAVLDQRETKLGLDLQGGVQLVYEAAPTAQQPTVTSEALQRALDIMRERVDALGVSEPELLQSGRNQIEVSLPGVENGERAAQQVGSTAQLTFYDWEAVLLDQDCRTDADRNADERQPITGFFQAVQQASRCDPQRDGDAGAADRPRFYTFDAATGRALNNGQPSETRAAALEDLDVPGRARAQVVEVSEGILVVRDQKVRADAPDPDRFWVVLDEPALSGTDIRNPEQDFDERLGHAPNVRFEFTDAGREAFQEITRAIAQRGRDNAFRAAGPQHFAIVLDDELVSAPSIDYVEYPDGIDGSQGAQISGGFTIQTAQDLARLLKIGALPLRLELISRSQVSATLGRQALDQGLIAGLAGFAIVALFLLVFYRVLGLIAVLALGIYALYFLALIRLIPITLTLPGIAGLILTIGVAADANIVIFERVKEEIRDGRSISSGIAAGYRKGFATIVDANIVTLLVAFILFILATAGVKGFAFVLGVGTLVSLFTAVLATQAILLSMRGSRLLRRPLALGAGKPRMPISFDFVGKSKWFFAMSGVILLICALAIGSKGLNLGIDFESGTRITAALEQPATVEDVRSAVARAGFGDARIQTVDNEELGSNVVQISAEESGRTDQVTDALRSEFGVRGEPEVTEVGPTFGRTVANSALTAILASLSVISIYIAVRFEWKFAVAGADRADARRPHHRGRLRPRGPGGDDVDGRGAAHHPGLLALRHDHRVRPHPGERPADAELGVLPDRQPLDERGHRAFAGHLVLHDLAAARAVPVRWRHAAGLRLRTDHRHAVGRVFVGLHRRPRARALEGARAGVPDAPGPDPRAARLRAGLRPRARRRRAEAPPRGRPDHGGADGRRPWPPREAALMGALVWVMMGLALWHFAIFLPDRFWSGIIGAFLGALIGSLAFGLAINGFTVPGPNDTDLVTALEVIPGAIAGMAVVYVIGLRDAIRSGRSRCAGQRDGGGPRRSLR